MPRVTEPGILLLLVVPAFGGTVAPAQKLTRTPIEPVRRAPELDGWLLAGPFADHSVASRRQYDAIEAELADAERRGTPLPEWAGDYFGLSDEWHLAPRAGFAYLVGSCFGVTSLNYGTIASATAERITLELRIDPRRNVDEDGFGRPVQAVGGVLHIVPWNELLFAIPACRMEEFCFAVNADPEFARARFASKRRNASVRLDRRSASLPLVPTAFAHFLLAHPLVGTIMHVGPAEELARLESGGAPKRGLVATVDVGRRSGLAPGMHLWMHERASDYVGTVVACDDASSSVRFLGGWTHVPQPGWRVTTSCANR